MAKVTVYAFLSHQTRDDEAPVRLFKATKEAIARITGATPIESSAEEVDEALLDGDGRYVPRS